MFNEYVLIKAIETSLIEEGVFYQTLVLKVPLIKSLCRNHIFILIQLVV